jgi:hypothetical protein
MNVQENLTQLSQSITDSLIWKPSIKILSSHFEQSLDNTISPKTTNQTKQQLVDISNFLVDEDEASLSNSVSMSCFRLALGYPPKAALEIEGYLGLAEESNVVNVLKTAAAAGGTVLVTNSVKTGRRLVKFIIVATKSSSQQLLTNIRRQLLC